MSRFLNSLCLCVSVVLFCSIAAADDWKPVPGNLMTKWAADVKPDAPLPEYPRPQMVRQKWANLNGLWDYAITPRTAAAAPAKWDGKILVPFCFESALSGVKHQITADDRVWYHRTFTIDPGWAGQHILLHFGAVDYETVVTVNGTEVGRHTGGYDPIDLDITAALKPGENDLLVNVYDATSMDQPIGKQRVKGGGIFYTGCTGIWQTVWLEPVPERHVASVRITTDIDKGDAMFSVGLAGGAVDVPDGNVFLVKVYDGDNLVGQNIGPANVVVPIPTPNLWSPDSPHLYRFQIKCNDDPVEGYFAMRKISLGKDDQGRTRIMLNNQFVFQRGVLDQGYWPDGIYTAPTDDALKFDIEMTKRLGFNLSRKHAKVEPDRWYYWCDKLGLLVWQDMPQAFSNKLPEAASKQWDVEWSRIMASLQNHPSIVVWTTFNEGWAEHDAKRIVEATKAADPTRLVNVASGWNDVAGVGDIHDTHHYPPPGCTDPEPTRAVVCGEFGGLGMKIPDHMWTKESWGYQGLSSDQWHLTNHYQRLLKQAWNLKDERGMSAFVYTQLTDVETESNGLMTYDRAVVKPDEKIAAAATAGTLTAMPPNPNPEVLPTSVDDPAEWKYTTDKPADDWFKPGFDESKWKAGNAPFGHEVGHPNTQWRTDDIWIRREVTLPDHMPANLVFNVLHDEDCEIYVNGILAGAAKGVSPGYEQVPINDTGKDSIKAGKNLIAVHCNQTVGAQIIDVGIDVKKK